MNEPHVIVERGRIVTSNVILRPWSRDDAEEALEIYGDPATAGAIGRRRPVADVGEMRDVLDQWNLESSRSPVPQGKWAVEAVDDERLLGGATLLPFSAHQPELVMGWHLRPSERGHGVATAIGHALAHQAFSADDVNEVFVAAAESNTSSLAVARRLGMTEVATHEWSLQGVRLVVHRMSRDGLHAIRPGISLDNSYNPDGLNDW